MKKPFIAFGEHLVLGIDLSRPARKWQDEAVNIAEWRTWDATWRRRLGRWSALRFFKKASEPKRYTIASCHWPHRLCWDWFLSLAFHRKGYSGKRALRFIINRQMKMAHISLFGPTLSLHWQDSAYMAASGPVRANAPRIIWRHELTEAKVAGSA